MSIRSELEDILLAAGHKVMARETEELLDALDDLVREKAHRVLEMVVNPCQTEPLSEQCDCAGFEGIFLKYSIHETMERALARV